MNFFSFEKNNCKSIPVYGGEKEEDYSFINPQTIKVIDQWMKYRKSKGELIDEKYFFFDSCRW